MAYPGAFAPICGARPARGRFPGRRAFRAALTMPYADAARKGDVRLRAGGGPPRPARPPPGRGRRRRAERGAPWTLRRKHGCACRRAHEKPLDPAPGRSEHGHEVLKDRVGDAFHEGLMVAEGEHVELEALGLHAPFVRDVFHADGAEVRLARHRAERREFGKRDADHIRPMRIAVGKRLQQRGPRAVRDGRQGTAAEQAQAGNVIPVTAGHGSSSSTPVLPWL